MTIKEKIQEIYDATSQESKDKYEGKVGIYSITINNEVVYVGKSTNILNRWIAHKIHTTWPESRDYNSIKYSQMRRALELGYNINMAVIEFCTKDIIDDREKYWIRHYNPAFNTYVPSFDGTRMIRKQVKKIF